MANVEVSVDFGIKHQEIHGFGFCQAFQRAAIIRGLFGLPSSASRDILDLLFSQQIGAGLSMLRLCIGSSSDDEYDHQKSIQPTDPGGPQATPRYVWDGDDGGQVWLAKQAQAYGVRRFCASAWSAPGYMKTNGDDSNGGTLCGLPGAVCTSGDWREAYANYLIQYVHFYAQEGIKITDLGFANEPEIARKYATMQLDHRQAVDLARVVGRAVQQSKLDLNIVCCDSLDWNLQAGFTAALEADPVAASCIAVHSAHQYGFPDSDLVASPPVPLPTRKSAWMTEWSPDVDGKGWNEAWDDSQLTDGIRVAEHIHDCLTQTRANAYFYWFGASTGGTRAFVQINGDSYRVSKRLWAMAAFSRFVRPGAVRVAVSSPHDLLKVTAFENVNSTAVIELLNLSGEALHLELKIDGWPGRVHASSYVTSQEHSLVQAGVLPVSRGTISVNIAPRTLLTLVGER